MRICKQLFVAVVLMLFCVSGANADSTESGYSNYFSSGDDFSNLVTTIHYDDLTGSVTGTSTHLGATGQETENIFAGLAQTNTSEPRVLTDNSLGKYRTFANSNQAVHLNTLQTGSSASGIPQYKNIQNALMTMPTAVLTGGYLNQLHSYEEAFHNTDLQMMASRKERLSRRYANQYAVVDVSDYDYTAYPSAYSPTIIYSNVRRSGVSGGLWFRPYVSTGSINFKNGKNVDNTMYGVYIGGDSSMKHLKHSDFQYSLYASYNGSHQSYDRNKIYQNGGLAGITGSWYGENSFVSLTVNAGASGAEIKTDYANKNYPFFTAGVAAKTGYNFEFADGKFIIQPNYLMSYSFVAPFEKGKIAGMGINSKPLNALNISPGIKFIGNFENGLQPYIEASFVWSLFDKTNYSTAYVDIPSISVKPYAQYGFGIQKLWGERSSGYLRFMMRSGGRNDIAFNAGYRCALGN